MPGFPFLDSAWKPGQVKKIYLRASAVTLMERLIILLAYYVLKRTVI